MIGQFPPPITGEAKINKVVQDVLINDGYEVRVVDSCIISSVDDVGVFRLSKLIRLFKVYMFSTRYIFDSNMVYMTPGQSLLGLVRFLPILLLANMLNKTVFIHWHGYGLLPLFKKYSFFSTIYFNSKSINILLTKDLVKKLFDIGVNISNARVLHNFSECKTLSIDEIDIKSESDFSDTKPLKVMFLGGLMIEKGIDTYLSLAKELNRFEFHVCGSGSKSVVDLANELNCDSKIIYHGVVDGAKKKKLLTEMDVFVLQTYYPTEGVPLSLLEAMSCGCAIVTTEHNGIPEAVGDAGIFVSPKSVTSLNQALQFLNDNRDSLKLFKIKSLEQSKMYSFLSFRKSFLQLILESKVY
jgi:glycosyltransferase involved in cell wall biosynthesis